MGTGPLQGIRILGFAGIGPGPFPAMMVPDMGAEVLRIDRAGSVSAPIPSDPHWDIMQRGRRSVALDLKHPDAIATALRMIERADALIEGFRPGVTERLGLGPDVCLARNPRLVYGRMTGWGQTGPLSHAAGHDWNYIAITGALHPIGRKGEPPVPPLNLVGDFGGGALFLALGIVAGMLEAERSGQGQVVDAAITDGAASPQRRARDVRRDRRRRAAGGGAALLAHAGRDPAPAGRPGPAHGRGARRLGPVGGRDRRPTRGRRGRLTRAPGATPRRRAAR